MGDWADEAESRAMDEMLSDEFIQTEAQRTEAQRMERRWKRGKHKTKEGEIIKIKDMETSHLRNTINFFSNLDTLPLKRELNKRN